jgi:LmbE family N-acetylglucosaminyl deacetylase
MDFSTQPTDGSPHAPEWGSIRKMKRTIAIGWLIGVGLFSAAEEVPKSGAELLKVDILGVFAHPDDETSAAPTLAMYALDRGSRVAMAYCTRGEGGGNMVGTQAGAALGLLREVELRACLRKLGIERCYFLDREDFFYTESLALTFEKWDYLESLGRLVRVIRALRPEVIITMNPAPTPGQHGNHQAAGWLATEAFDGASLTNWFPEQFSKEGLQPWQTKKLYYVDRPPGSAVVDVGTPLRSGKSPALIAAEAGSEHRSQAFGNLAASSWFRRLTNQYFLLIKSVVQPEMQERDLLAGLPIKGGVASRARLSERTNEIPKLEVRFVDRPALDRYRQWVREEGIADRAVSLPIDLPVVEGRPSQVRLDLINRGSLGTNTMLELEGPAGWGIEPARSQVRLSGNRTNRLSVAISPPAGVSGNGTLIAHVNLDGQPVSLTAQLHVVPHLIAPRCHGALQMTPGTGDAAWLDFPVTGISYTNTWQGAASSAADCSAAFRLAHDGTTFFVEVVVRDDHLVSNLAPDDIKAHWRTDSVEICVDPQPGSEHTAGCFKLGIVPFDAAGQVRGERDADAKPGPAEETTPGTRLVSWRTADGYAIRAAIPWNEIGVKFPDTHEVGFNILDYDGDKPGAVLGKTSTKAGCVESARRNPGAPGGLGKGNA